MFLFLSITLPTNQNFSLPPLKKKTLSLPFSSLFEFFLPHSFSSLHFYIHLIFFALLLFISTRHALHVHISTTFIFLVFISPFASRVFFLPSSSLLFILFYFFVSFFLTLTDKESGRYRRLRFFFFSRN